MMIANVPVVFSGKAFADRLPDGDPLDRLGSCSWRWACCIPGPRAPALIRVSSFTAVLRRVGRPLQSRCAPAVGPPLRLRRCARGTFAIHGQLTYTEQATADFTRRIAGPEEPDPEQERRDRRSFAFHRRADLVRAEIWTTAKSIRDSVSTTPWVLPDFRAARPTRWAKNQPYVRLNAPVRAPDLEPRRSTRGGRGGADAARRQPSSGLLDTRPSGKFSVPDIFDNNQYAHDSKNDFLNWTALDAGSYDYAADVVGLSVGAAAEWYHDAWALRFGIFDLSNIPNSPDLEPAFHEFQYDAEAEKGFQIAGRAGKLRLTAFDSRGRMGLLDQAVALAESTGTPVNIASVRSYRSRMGASLDLEQQLAADLGLFARLGKAAGNVEAYEFTDVDRSVSAGLSLQGTRWSRPEDTVGLAG